VSVEQLSSLHPAVACCVVVNFGVVVSLSAYWFSRFLIVAMCPWSQK
jgi:hypothetical protein